MGGKTAMEFDAAVDVAMEKDKDEMRHIREAFWEEIRKRVV